MKCPYRKQTEEVDGTTSEYFMECEGKECPFYYSQWEIVNTSTGTRGYVDHCAKAEREIKGGRQ